MESWVFARYLYRDKKVVNCLLCVFVRHFSEQQRNCFRKRNRIDKKSELLKYYRVILKRVKARRALAAVMLDNAAGLAG
jgi:hypothetical protein